VTLASGALQIGLLLYYYYYLVAVSKGLLAEKLFFKNILQFLTGVRVTQADLYNGHRAAVVLVTTHSSWAHDNMQQNGILSISVNSDF